MNSVSSGLVARELHTCLAHAFGEALEESSLAEVWAEDPLE